MLIHRYAGYKLLLRMAARRFGPDAVRGYPAARTAAERADATLLPLLGAPHDESAAPDGGGGGAPCGCALCAFNRGGDGAPTLMIADAKECGEGVSFLGARLTLTLTLILILTLTPTPTPTLTLTPNPQP